MSRDRDDRRRPDPHDEAPDLTAHDEQFEIVSTIVRRPPGRRISDAVLTPLPAARPVLAPPLVPHKDPIPHILPHGSIATLSGASGVGKTAWTAGLIRDLQNGAPFYGHATNIPPAIGYIAADRPWRDHQQWFERAGCAPFPSYSLPDDQAFNWNRFRDWKQASAIFAECLDRLALPPGSLVIVDPLPLFIPGRLIDYKDTAIGVRVLDAEGLRPRQLSMLGIFHVAKQKANKNDRYLRPQDRILGSGGQVGYSETAIYLMSPDEADKPHYEIGWVPHQIPAESAKLKRDERGLFIPYDEIYDDLSLLAAALTVFEDRLPHASSIANTQVAKACNCAVGTARRYVQRLMFEGKIARVGRGQYQLADAASQTLTAAVDTE